MNPPTSAFLAPNGNHISRRLFRYALLLLIIQSQGGAYPGRYVNVDGHLSQPQIAPVEEPPGCNEFFTLDQEDYDAKRYEATLLLKTNVPLRDVQVDIRFDRAVDLLGTYFGTSSTTNNRDFRIVKQNFNVHAGATLKLKIEVNFSTTLMPWLEVIQLNGKVLCPKLPEEPRSTIAKDRPTVYRFAPSTWTLRQQPVASSREFVGASGYPVLVSNRGYVYPVQNPRAAPLTDVPRNFTNNHDSRFNSSCQVMSPNIATSDGRWDGVATLVAEESMDTVRIEVVFDKPIYILGPPEDRKNLPHVPNDANNNNNLPPEAAALLLGQPSTALRRTSSGKWNELDGTTGLKSREHLCIRHDRLRRAMENHGHDLSGKLTRLIKATMDGTQCCVRNSGELSSSFESRRGLRQGDSLPC
ncbi:uncharacterized protein LOC129753798 [Uranotaenia lowii]|uniref:uncharacterized protein LOC129753798 n=1 Tax=Uranotaenia lowii TaxID=190385 RepID=UPI00247AC022|nr:uncharacterized protein LOC129753798 [Uranotaenia lowii]